MLNISECSLGPESILIDAVEKLHTSSIDIILIINEEKHLLGVITDGDLRKSILLGAPNNDSVLKHMNSSPITLDSTNLKSAFALSYETNLSSIPVVKDKIIIALFVRQLKGFVTYEDSSNIQEKISDNTIALIMAGGEGKRLRPYTENIPKSLAKIGKTTLVERNLQLLAQAGIKKVYIAVNYLAEKIINKLNNGDQYGLEISYLKEEEKLGTAGPINLLKDVDFSNLIVLNADIVCDLIYSRLYSFHVKNKNDLTVVCSKNFLPINYGVITSDPELDITGIEEKPIKEFWCAAGIYMFQRETLINSFSKKTSYIDMPDLINNYLKKNYKSKIFPLMPNYERWFDVADLNDLEQINSEEWTHNYQNK